MLLEVVVQLKQIIEPI